MNIVKSLHSLVFTASASICLHICTGEWEGAGEEGEAQSSKVKAHNGPLYPHPGSSSPSSTTPIGQRPVYLPSGPGSISGATPTGPTHRHCQALCAHEPEAWQQYTSLGTPRVFVPCQPLLQRETPSLDSQHRTWGARASPEMAPKKTQDSVATIMTSRDVGF